jgi:hypothetical protein
MKERKKKLPLYDGRLGRCSLVRMLERKSKASKERVACVRRRRDPNLIDMTHRSSLVFASFTLLLVCQLVPFAWHICAPLDSESW